MDSRKGIIKAAYYVKHRLTGEVCMVELGARYDQTVWGLMYPVSMPDVTQS